MTVILLGAAAMLFMAVNLSFYIGSQADQPGEFGLSLVFMAAALITAIGVIIITSYVIRTVKREAELALEVERLRAKANLADSLRELRHDFDNQLTVVLALLQMGHVSRAVHYLQGITRRDTVLLDEGNTAEAFYGFLAQKGLEAFAETIHFTNEVQTGVLPMIPVEDLTRIAGNLFDNALEAARHAQEGGKVNVISRLQAEDWQLVVWNNGRHIPEERLKQVFEGGFTTKREGEGHGLGLAVIQRLMETHAGTVDVASDAINGTTFTISLPAK